jgi:hypothetical protein
MRFNARIPMPILLFLSLPSLFFAAAVDVLLESVLESVEPEPVFKEPLPRRH